MRALAISMKPEAMGFWGVDMGDIDEYRDQRPGFWFFKREAEKHDIEIIIPVESELSTEPLAYPEVSPNLIQMQRRMEVKKASLVKWRLESCEALCHAAYNEGVLLGSERPVSGGDKEEMESQRDERMKRGRRLADQVVLLEAQIAELVHAIACWGR